MYDIVNVIIMSSWCDNQRGGERKGVGVLRGGGGGWREKTRKERVFDGLEKLKFLLIKTDVFGVGNGHYG